ncbi:MAG: O-antigen ligase family protein [Candidatus Pacebacteria bacterium]|nr:O-antigen ligase family protein [Candidatus Paceibacterota bacterium]
MKDKANQNQKKNLIQPGFFFKKMAQAFFWLFLLVYPFGQFSKVPQFFLPSEAKVFLTDIFLFLTLLSWVIFHKITGKKIRLPSLSQPILAFFCLAGFSLLANVFFMSFGESIIASLYLWRWLFYAGLYFFVYDFGFLLWPGLSIQDKLAKLLAQLGFVLALLGLIQYLVWPDLRALEFFDWDPHYFRVVSSFLDPGFTGLVLVFALVLIVSELIRKKKSKKKVWILSAKGVVVYLALALTYSRSSYLAYLTAAAIIGYFKKSIRFFLIALTILVLTIFVLPRGSGGEGVKLSRLASIEARIKNWHQSWVIFTDHPVWGVGYNRYRYVQRDYGFLGQNWQRTHAGAGADSSLLLVLATTGITGFFIYLWLWFRMFGLVLAGVKKGKKNDFCLAILAILASLWTHSFFLNSQFYPWVMIWVWLLMASVEVLKVDS